MSLAWVFDVNKNVIKVNNNEKIEFLGQDLVNITLEGSRYVRQPKRHYLVLEVSISSMESRLLFIALFYPHLIINTCEIKLGKSFCLT